LRAFLAILLLATACPAPRSVPLAEKLSDVPVLSESGERQSLVALGAGRPMVVDLFATWCETCRDQVPALSALASRESARLLVVGVDIGEKASEVKAQLRGFGAIYPVYFDPEFQFADSLGISQLPAMLVVDRNGVIRHRARTLDADARKAIDALLATPAE
jgi:thiol-disulfide isomerase/thioredoxin